MMADFLTPHPAAIDRISPSLANRLLSCGLRVAFERDPLFAGWRRPSNFSALGEVAHDVAEAVERRSEWSSDPAQRRQEAEEIWCERLEAAASRLRAAWAPATLPDPQDWPGYHLIHARTITRALKRGRVAPTDAVLDEPASRPGGPEQHLEDEATGLWGRADQIDWRDGEARIVDLKSGMNQGDPTDDQRRQLLLYAALVHAATGVWASEIAIEDASGERKRLPFDSTDAEAAVAEVLASRDDFNERTANQHLLSATPDPERCRWCEFKIACGPYWAEVSVDWNHSAVMGEVLDCGSATTGTFVRLAARGPKELDGETLNLTSVPIGATDVLQNIAVTGAIGRRDSNSMRTRWYSRVRTW